MLHSYTVDSTGLNVIRNYFDEEEVVCRCGNPDVAKMIVKFANFQITSHNRGFSGIFEEIDVFANFAGDMIEIMRKYPDSPASKEIAQVFKKISEAKKVLRTE